MLRLAHLIKWQKVGSLFLPFLTMFFNGYDFLAFARYKAENVSEAIKKREDLQQASVRGLFYLRKINHGKLDKIIKRSVKSILIVALDASLACFCTSNCSHILSNKSYLRGLIKMSVLGWMAPTKDSGCLSHSSPFLYNLFYLGSWPQGNALDTYRTRILLAINSF